VLDWTSIIIGVVAALPPTLIGIATLIQQVRTHTAFNSKMDAMLELTRRAAFAEGERVEKEKKHETQKAPP